MDTIEAEAGSWQSVEAHAALQRDLQGVLERLGAIEAASRQPVVVGAEGLVALQEELRGVSGRLAALEAAEGAPREGLSERLRALEADGSGPPAALREELRGLSERLRDLEADGAGALATHGEGDARASGGAQEPSERLRPIEAVESSRSVVNAQGLSERVHAIELRSISERVHAIEAEDASQAVSRDLSAFREEVQGLSERLRELEAHASSQRPVMDPAGVLSMQEELHQALERLSTIEADTASRQLVFESEGSEFQGFSERLRDLETRASARPADLEGLSSVLEELHSVTERLSAAEAVAAGLQCAPSDEGHSALQEEVRKLSERVDVFEAEAGSHHSADVDELRAALRQETDSLHARVQALEVDSRSADEGLLAKVLRLEAAVAAAGGSPRGGPPSRSGDADPDLALKGLREEVGSLREALATECRDRERAAAELWEELAEQQRARHEGRAPRDDDDDRLEAVLEEVQGAAASMRAANERAAAQRSEVMEQLRASLSEETASLGDRILALEVAAGGLRRYVRESLRRLGVDAGDGEPYSGADHEMPASQSGASRDTWEHGGPARGLREAEDLLERHAQMLQERLEGDSEGTSSELREHLAEVCDLGRRCREELQESQALLATTSLSLSASSLAASRRDDESRSHVAAEPLEWRTTLEANIRSELVEMQGSLGERLQVVEASASQAAMAAAETAAARAAELLQEAAQREEAADEWRRRLDATVGSHASALEEQEEAAEDLRRRFDAQAPVAGLVEEALSDEGGRLCEELRQRAEEAATERWQADATAHLAELEALGSHLKAELSGRFEDAEAALGPAVEEAHACLDEITRRGARAQGRWGAGLQRPGVRIAGAVCRA